METSDPVCRNRFHSVAGVKMVFDPADTQSGCRQKHKCADCHFCQGCSESRCQTCRGGKSSCLGASGHKLSIREQIRLYEQINKNME